MEIAVVVIGDELLIGQVVDTNSGDIARMVAPAGWTVRCVTTVHDDAAAIREAIDDAMSKADIVLTTGASARRRMTLRKLPCVIFSGERWCLTGGC